MMGGSAQKLKEDLASPVTFSPDGTKYAFVRESDEREYAHDCGSRLRRASRDSFPASCRKFWIIRHGRPTAGSSRAPPSIPLLLTRQGKRRANHRGSRSRMEPSERYRGQTWGFIRQLAWLGDGQWTGDERPRSGVRNFSCLVRFLPGRRRAKSDGRAESSERAPVFPQIRARS